MKHYIYTVLLLTFLSIRGLNAQTWTEVYPGFVGENYIAVEMPSATTAYISGYNGKMIKTTDGGDNWALITTGTDINFECIGFTDEDNGFAAGGGDLILRTVDGGDNWTEETVSGFKYGFSFPTSDIGYVCGAEGMAAKFEDNAWSTLTTGTSRVLYDVHFHDANTGLIFGGFFDTDCVIKKTIDGGDNWTNVSTPNENAIYGVHFPSADVGYAVGWDGNIMKTDNGGDTWTEQTSGSTEVLQKVFFTDENNGYVTGTDGTLLKTTDGGENWETVTLTYTDDLYGICFAGPDLGYAVGTNQNILKYSISSSLSEHESLPTVSPIPCDSYITIKLPSSIEQDGVINIYDLTGKLAASYPVSDTGSYSVGHLKSGIYFITIPVEDGITTSKFVKK